MTTESAEQLEQRFEMGPESVLSVSNVSGRIAVHAHEEPEIVVKFLKRGSTKAQENTQVDIRREDNRVSVHTRSLTAGLINFGRSSLVDYDIAVPRDCRLILHGVSSEIDVRGSRADVGVQTVSGDVDLQDVAGDVTVTTVSGDLHGQDIVGSLGARTTSGDGDIKRARLRRFSINTVSGDFTLETPLVRDEHCHAKTVSGDLGLLVPPDTGATIQLKSLSGDVSCTLPAEIIKSGRRSWQGRINGGGAHVEMNSVSGDLRISASTDWSPAAPKPPMSPTPTRAPRPPSPADTPAPSTEAEGRRHASTAAEETDPTTSHVLRALERGEISVDEAMAKLEGEAAESED